MDWTMVKTTDKPFELTDTDREMLSKQEHCWSCCGSDHYGADSVCPNKKIELEKKDWMPCTKDTCHQKNWKKLVSGENCRQRLCTKDVVNKTVGITETRVRISMCAIQNDVAKVKGKHLVFKTSIAGIYTHLLIDNGSNIRNSGIRLRASNLAICRQLPVEP